MDLDFPFGIPLNQPEQIAQYSRKHTLTHPCCMCSFLAHCRSRPSFTHVLRMLLKMWEIPRVSAAEGILTLPRTALLHCSHKNFRGVVVEVSAWLKLRGIHIGHRRWRPLLVTRAEAFPSDSRRVAVEAAALAAVGESQVIHLVGFEKDFHGRL